MGKQILDLKVVGELGEMFIYLSHVTRFLLSPSPGLDLLHSQ